MDFRRLPVILHKEGGKYLVTVEMEDRDNSKIVSSFGPRGGIFP